MHRHKSSLYSPYKIPQHRLCKMLQHLPNPRKSTKGSGTCKMRGQSPCRIPDHRSGGSKMHRYRSRP